MPGTNGAWHPVLQTDGVTDTVLDRWRRRNWVTSEQTTRLALLKPVTVITGASEGIGRALAEEFARGGHDLLLVARSAAGLAVAAAGLASTGVHIRTLTADLATAAGCASVEAELSASGCTCDVLVNNAGVGLGGPFAEQDANDLNRLVDLNLRAVTDLTRRFLPAMLARGAGGVLNVASLGGLAPGPQQAAYYASKAYVISLTEALDSETAGQGVRISALLPGAVATKFHARMGAEHSYYLTVTGVMSAQQVARAGYRGFRRGQTLIYPGLFHHFNALALHYVPHWVMIPVIGWLLRQRQAG